MHFIRSIASTVLHIDAGHLTPYAGDYDYYLEKSQATSERDALIAPLAKGNDRIKQSALPDRKHGLREIRERHRADAERKQAFTRERRAREKDLLRLEATILRLETKQRELAMQLEHPDLYRNAAKPLALHRELSTVTSELETANVAWNKTADALSTPADA